MVEFKQELEDLMSEHECLSINLIASELNIHINKGKFSKFPGHHRGRFLEDSS